MQCDVFLGCHPCARDILNTQEYYDSFNLTDTNSHPPPYPPPQYQPHYPSSEEAGPPMEYGWKPGQQRQALPHLQIQLQPYHQNQPGPAPQQMQPYHPQAPEQYPHRKNNSHLKPILKIRPERSHSEPPTPTSPIHHHRHHKQDHRSHYTPSLSPSRSSSPSRSIPHSRSRSHTHSSYSTHSGHPTKPRRNSHSSRNTFLGSFGGGFVGDLIFPGLGTLAGALAGGIGGYEHSKSKERVRGKGHERMRESGGERERGRSEDTSRGFRDREGGKEAARVARGEVSRKDRHGTRGRKGRYEMEWEEGRRRRGEI